MSYWDDKYPKMPSFRMSLAIVTKGVLTAWLTRTDWYELRRDVREIGESLWNLFLWLVAWIGMIVACLIAPVSVLVGMILVRREQRRVMIANRKRYLRDRLRNAVKGYSWG